MRNQLEIEKDWLWLNFLLQIKKLSHIFWKTWYCIFKYSFFWIFFYDSVVDWFRPLFFMKLFEYIGQSMQSSLTQTHTLWEKLYSYTSPYLIQLLISFFLFTCRKILNFKTSKTLKLVSIQLKNLHLLKIRHSNFYMSIHFIYMFAMKD